MPAQVTRRGIERWLLAHGFVRLSGKATGHIAYESRGIKISLQGHGPQDLTKKHVGMILRALEGIGFEKTKTRKELEQS